MKLSTSFIELMTTLNDSDLECESRDDPHADRSWKPKTSQNVGDVDFSDSVGNCDQRIHVGNIKIIIPNQFEIPIMSVLEHTNGRFPLQNVVEVNIG